jgi:hypothetical protein
MSLFEATSSARSLVRLGVGAGLLLAAVLCSIAAGAQAPSAPQAVVPAPPGDPAPPPPAAVTSPAPSEAAPTATAAPAAAPGPAASDPSRAKDKGVRTTTRARQRLRECRAEASKRPHLWGLARVKFIKRCRRMAARP